MKAQPVMVWLNESETKEAIAEGQRRKDEWDVQEHHGGEAFLNSYLVHIIGCLGEVAAFKMYIAWGHETVTNKDPLSDLRVDKRWNVEVKTVKGVNWVTMGRAISVIQLTRKMEHNDYVLWVTIELPDWIGIKEDASDLIAYLESQLWRTQIMVRGWNYMRDFEKAKLLKIAGKNRFGPHGDPVILESKAIEKKDMRNFDNVPGHEVVIE
jgi:hypothetical protein